MPRKNESSKKKADTPAESSELIALQTEKFLKEGGKVDVIQQGVSGREPTEGRQHISYAKK